MTTPIMEITGLNVEYDHKIKAVQNVNLTVNRSECLAIVGESGSGKSTLIRAAAGLLEENAETTGGSIKFNDIELLTLREREWKAIHGSSISMVMQNSSSSFDSLITVGRQIAESIRANKRVSRGEAKRQAIATLNDVGLNESTYMQLPSALSGGMCQRAAIACALASNPVLLFCDEFTSALDTTSQARVLQVLRELQRNRGIAIVMVTHDMGVVAKLADKVAVMYAGQIVEYGTAEEIFFDPRHPYTWSLLASLPQLADGGLTETADISKVRSDRKSEGEAFAERNPWALEVDFHAEAPVFRVSDTHWAKTWLLDARAPHIDPPEAIRRIKEMGKC